MSLAPSILPIFLPLFILSHKWVYLKWFVNCKVPYRTYVILFYFSVPKLAYICHTPSVKVLVLFISGFICWFCFEELFVCLLVCFFVVIVLVSVHIPTRKGISGIFKT